MRYMARIKQRVNEIPFKKGTLGWLNKFITIMWQNGFGALRIYDLTPEQVFRLKFIAKEAISDKIVPFSDKGVFDFLQKYSFRLSEKDSFCPYEVNLGRQAV